MQEYDVALKLLLRGPATLLMRQLAGTTVTKWLDVELPKVQNLRLDLLGETAAGGLVHVELQSRNDAGMALRMAEYCLSAFRLLKQFPRQVVLYVGEPALNMESGLRGPDVLFQYRLVDIRTLNRDRLLESDEVGDNIMRFWRDCGTMKVRSAELWSGLRVSPQQSGKNRWPSCLYWPGCGA
jgi:hypothetical protein